LKIHCDNSIINPLKWIRSGVCATTVAKGERAVFKNINKIVIPKKESKSKLASAVCQRSQCRTTHKRQDC